MSERFTGAYPPDWREIAARVKGQAGNRCIRCGHPDEPPWKVPAMVRMWQARTGLDLTGPATCDERCSHPVDGKQRMLTVHHADNNKANVAWYNLLALCQSCHLVIQGRVVMERPWMLDHSPWFRPYVAGYYAAQHGLPTDREWVLRNIEALILMGQGRIPAVAAA